MNHPSSTESNPPFLAADPIARRAYELWENEGRPEGSDLRHWLQAEQELSTHASTSSDAPMSSNSTGTEVQPLEETRAANPVNRSPKRDSNSPFGERSRGNGNSQSSTRRKGSQSALL